MSNAAPCKGVMSHRIMLSDKEQVKETVSPGQYLLDLGVSVATKLSRLASCAGS